MRYLDVLGVLLLLIATTASWGQTQADGGLRIAFVNAARIVESAPQAAEARKRLEDEFAPRDRELVARQKRLRDMEDAMSAGSNLANDTERRHTEREILAEKRELKRDQDEFREDLNIRRNEEFGKLQRLVADTITMMAREQQFDLVVNEAAVVYASDRVDITEQVLERLHQNQ